MIAVLKQVIDLAEKWPSEDQYALVEAAREIQAVRDGVYLVNEDERAAIEEGLAQARRGDVTGEAEMAQFWKNLGG